MSSGKWRSFLSAPCRSKMIIDCDVDSGGTQYQPYESKALHGEIAQNRSPSGKFANTAATEFPIYGDRNEFDPTLIKDYLILLYLVNQQQIADHTME